MCIRDRIAAAETEQTSEVAISDEEYDAVRRPIPQRTSYDPVSYTHLENKPTNRERLREITDGIEQGIKELFESEKYMRYLSVMSRFHRYSCLFYTSKEDE